MKKISVGLLCKLCLTLFLSGFHCQDFYSVINEDYLRNRNELEIAKVA